MAQLIVGSKMSDSVSAQLKPPADNKKTLYGQNAYKGASSDTDLKNPTQSALAAAMPCDLAAAHDDDWQKRTVDNTPFPSAHGMAKRGLDDGSPGGKIGGALTDNAGTVARKPGA